MNLFENFNISNVTCPRFEKHENFVIDLKEPGCELVQTLDFEDRCTFVQTTAQCSEDIQIFDYTYLFYCSMKPETTGEHVLGIFAYFLLCFSLFGFVGTTTDKLFCPPLKVITNSFGISENLAGVTLLAFGNSAPDLLGCIVGMTGDVSTLYSDLMGSAMFSVTFIAGYIMIVTPLQVESTQFARDISFQVLAIIFVDYAVKSDQSITLIESLLLMGIYFLYFTIIVVDQVVLTKTLKGLQKQLKGQDSITDAQAKRLKALQAEVGIDIVTKPKLRTNIYVSKKSQFSHNKNERIFKQFINSLKPFRMSEYRQGGLYDKVCTVFNIPTNFVLYILVPIVDYDEEITGWSKLLNCLQIIIMPAALTSVSGYNVLVCGIALPIFTLFISVPLAIFIFSITRTDRAPPFHLLYAFFAIIGSIALIDIFEKELINIIDVLGFVTYRSSSFLGCTILAWGNCVGDLVAGISIAKQGYARMALASCLGGPLFYFTLGLGSTYVHKTYEDQHHIFEVTQGSMGENCTVFVLANLAAMILGGATTNFKMRCSIGVHMLINYTLFCAYSLMGELQFIHPFGTDHTEEYGIFHL